MIRKARIFRLYFELLALSWVVLALGSSPWAKAQRVHELSGFQGLGNGVFESRSGGRVWQVDGGGFVLSLKDDKSLRIAFSYDGIPLASGAQLEEGTPAYGFLQSVQLPTNLPGLDIRYYYRQGLPEFDFLVSPEIDPHMIKIHLEGPEGHFSLGPQGQLAISTEQGRYTLQAPRSYQYGEKGPIERESYFSLESPVKSGILVPVYDKERLLVIDPVIDYSSFTSDPGCGPMGVGKVSLGPDGLMYNMAYVSMGKYQLGTISKNGCSGPLYTVDLGSGYKTCRFEMDPSGGYWIAGTTKSEDLPMVNPYQGFKNGFTDVFVVKLSKSGQVLFSTYFGGGSDEYLANIAVGTDGSLAITGTTKSLDFPSLNPLPSPARDREDIFVAKFSSNGTLVFSSAIGTVAVEGGRGIALGPDGDIYLGTSATHNSFPLKAGLQNPLNLDGTNVSESLLMRIDGTNFQVEFSTVFGGSGAEGISGVHLDDWGNIHVMGETTSKDFPIINAPSYPMEGRDDILVAKLSPDASQILYSTALGNDYDEVPFVSAIDSCGNLYVGGHSHWGNFPQVPADKPLHVGNYAYGFVFAMAGDGSGLLFSSYIGVQDMGLELPSQIYADGSGHVYVVGPVQSDQFPIYDSFDSTFKNVDRYVIRMDVSDICPPSSIPTRTPTPNWTPTANVSWTPTPTLTPPVVGTATFTWTPTQTHTPTATLTETLTGSPTHTVTWTPTFSVTPSVTPVYSPSQTPTTDPASASYSATRTQTPVYPLLRVTNNLLKWPDGPQKTQIWYGLSQPGKVDINTFDGSGNLVITLVQETNQAEGTYQLSWDGHSQLGQAVPSGIYFLVAQSADFNESVNIVVVR